MKTALLVIDLINDIVSADGKIPTCAAQVAERNVIQHANTAIEFARQHHWLILPVKVAFSSHYAEQPKDSPVFGKAHQIQALDINQKGTAFHPALTITPDDPVIIKHRISPFYGTPLDLVLRTHHITRLVICGVSSTWAIQAAARDGHDRDYQIVILEDACAAATQEEHQITMKQLSRIARIMTTSDLT